MSEGARGEKEETDMVNIGKSKQHFHFCLHSQKQKSDNG